MAFGLHWEWRGFGNLSRELIERIERLPRKFPSDQEVVDEYLWFPGSSLNLKLREGSLKLKRLLETSGEFERWLEDEDENYRFPLVPEALDTVLFALGLPVERSSPRVPTR